MTGDPRPAARAIPAEDDHFEDGEIVQIDLERIRARLQTHSTADGHYLDQDGRDIEVLLATVARLTAELERTREESAALLATAAEKLDRLTAEREDLMPEVNSESLVNRLLRENELLRKHGDSWSRDYKSLAAKLDAADAEVARLTARGQQLVTACQHCCWAIKFIDGAWIDCETHQSCAYGKNKGKPHQPVQED